MLGFVVLNASYAVMFPACIDCHAHVGVQFAYLDSGGFEGGGVLLWRGVFADLLLMLAAALVLALVLPHLRSPSGLEVAMPDKCPPEIGPQVPPSFGNYGRPTSKRQLFWLG